MLPELALPQDPSMVLGGGRLLMSEVLLQAYSKSLGRCVSTIPRNPCVRGNSAGVARNQGQPPLVVRSRAHTGVPRL